MARDCVCYVGVGVGGGGVDMLTGSSRVPQTSVPAEGSGQSSPAVRVKLFLAPPVWMVLMIWILSYRLFVTVLESPFWPLSGVMRR